MKIQTGYFLKHLRIHFNTYNLQNSKDFFSSETKKSKSDSYSLINTKDVSKNGVEFDVLNLFSGRDNRERLVRRMKSILTQNLIYLSKKWNTVFDSKRSLKVAVENFLLAHIKLHSECVTVSQCWAEIFFSANRFNYL